MPKTNMKAFYFFFVLILLCVATVSCQKQEYYPKPQGYHRIDLPSHSYHTLPPKYPYTFEFSEHAIILPDSSTIAEPYWIEINYPTLKASVSLSYKPLLNYDSLVGYVNTSSRLTHKHNIRSSSITEYPIKTPKGYGGVVSELSGDVPSFYQFWVTDSTQNFLRGALYFPTSQRTDSLAPVIRYVKEDMVHLLNTLDWVDTTARATQLR